MRTCGTCNIRLISDFKKITFFDQYPVVNPAEFQEKFQKTFFFLKSKKKYVPDVYRLKIIIFEQKHIKRKMQDFKDVCSPLQTS